MAGKQDDENARHSQERQPDERLRGSQVLMAAIAYLLHTPACRDQPFFCPGKERTVMLTGKGIPLSHYCFSFPKVQNLLMRKFKGMVTTRVTMGARALLIPRRFTSAHTRAMLRREVKP